MHAKRRNGSRMIKRGLVEQWIMFIKARGRGRIDDILSASLFREEIVMALDFLTPQFDQIMNDSLHILENGST